jgi:hypothetical protein
MLNKNSNRFKLFIFSIFAINYASLSCFSQGAFVQNILFTSELKEYLIKE